MHRGPVAPLTSVALNSDGSTVYAGCWDKTVYSWDVSSPGLPSKKFVGHSDFVKAVVCAKLNGKEVLISGGADKKIIIWDAISGRSLHVLRDQFDTMMAVQTLAIDPVASNEEKIVLVSGSSDPMLRFWEITQEKAEQVVDTKSEGEVKEGKREHETSVYGLCFDTTDEDGEYDLYTASADGTAKQLSRSRDWGTADIFEHGDYVRAVAVTDDWVITAGRNEDVKVWDRSSGKLWHTYDGHFEEVTGLVVVDGGARVVSVSIDGTVRTWSLTKADLAKAIKEKEDREKGVVKEVKVEKKSLMTAEEEAELAELMDDSD